MNIAIVMLLGGLWHGASWNFIIWGGLHGTYLGLERMLGKRPLYARLPFPFRVAVTFVLVNIGWVFFRADDLNSALIYLSSMFGVAQQPDTSLLLGGLLYTPYNFIAMVMAAGIVWFAPQSWDWSKKIRAGKLVILFMLLIGAVAVLSAQSYNPFIYFNF